MPLQAATAASTCSTNPISNSPEAGPSITSKALGSDYRIAWGLGFGV